MVARKAIGILGAAHVSGSLNARFLSPGGSGSDSTQTWLPSGVQFGTTGWVRIGFDAGTLVNGPFAINQIITGGTSGMKARVVEVTSANELICERMSILPPLVGVQASFKSLETITADNSPATSATVNYTIEDSHYVASGVALTYDNTLERMLGSKIINQIIPSNAGANIWWDRGAKLAATLAVASGAAVTAHFAATGGIGRIEGVTSGATALVVNVSSNTIYLGNIVGTFQNGERLKAAGATPGTFDTVDGNITLGTERITETAHGLVDGNVLRATQSGPGFPTSTPQIASNTDYYVVGVTVGTPNDFQISTSVGGTPVNFTSAATGATLTWTKYITTSAGTVTTKTLGEWVPYAVRPNLIGIGRGWEFPPAGSDTCYRSGLLGVEPKLMQLAYERWGSDLAAIKLDVNGSSAGNASGYGGVTYGLIKCTGSFPALTITHINAAMTASGGWTATLAAFNIAAKYIWVKNVSPGASLGAGTVTIGTGGGAVTATALGNVIGWMKGATHYEQFLTEIANAEAKLTGGDTLDWQMVFLDSVEGDAALPYYDGATSGGPSDVDMTAAWRAMYDNLSTDLGNANLVLSAFVHRSDYRATTKPGYSYVVGQALRQAVIGYPNLRIVVADDESFPPAVTTVGQIVTPAEVVYLETMAYPALGDLIWSAYSVASQSLSTSGFSEAAVVLFTGTSQMTARIPIAWWEAEDDPELAKVSSLNGTNTLDDGIWIWNSLSRQWEVYSVRDNAVTFGSQVLNWSGPEVSTLNRLKGRYPRIYAIKVSHNGAAMTPTPSTGFASWNVASRPTVTTTVAVTVPSAGLGRFTAASGAPFTGTNWAVGRFVEISGNDGGSGTYVGFGGNNTFPAPNANPIQINAVDPGGTWVQFSGVFVADASSTTTFISGPLDLRAYAGAEIAAALEALVVEERKIPRHVATITWDGENDCPTPDGYLDNALAHIDWCRSVFGHKIGNEPLCPHVWIKVTRNTPFDDDEGRSKVDAVRAAQAQLAVDRENVVLVETSDLPLRLEAGTWPRQTYADFGGHHTPRAAIIAGYRADEALNTFSWIPTHPDGAALTDYGLAASPYGGGGGDVAEEAAAPATFVVEDGTVVAGANSYATVAFADDYFANFGAPAAWTDSTTAQKEEALRIGTAWIDRKYAPRFKGMLTDYDQELEFPRSSVVDESGRWFESYEIPARLKRAVCEIALRHRNGVALWPDVSAEEHGVASESVQVDEISVSTTYLGTRATMPSFPVVDQLIRGLLIDGGSRLMVRVYR